MDQTGTDQELEYQLSPAELSRLETFFPSKRRLCVYLPQTPQESVRQSSEQPMRLLPEHPRTVIRPVFLPVVRDAMTYCCQVNSVTSNVVKPKPFLTPERKLTAKQPRARFTRRFAQELTEPRKFELTRITLGTNFTPKFVRTFQMKGMTTRSRNRVAHVFSVCSASRKHKFNAPHV